jgi:hypothetical protein
MIATVALIAGLCSLLAGLVKYRMDSHYVKTTAPTLSVSLGDQSIDVSNLSAEQVTALVTALKEQAILQKAA